MKRMKRSDEMPVSQEDLQGIFEQYGEEFLGYLNGEMSIKDVKKSVTEKVKNGRNADDGDPRG